MASTSSRLDPNSDQHSKNLICRLSIMCAIFCWYACPPTGYNDRLSDRLDFMYNSSLRKRIK